LWQAGFLPQNRLEFLITEGEISTNSLFFVICSATKPKAQTMGTKKSKGQANMGSMVSYQELKKLSHGTSVARFGVDSQV
jgi:hypothetical protein